MTGEESREQATPPVNNFHFINAIPATESEREHARLVVRSHSAQYGQRHRLPNAVELRNETPRETVSRTSASKPSKRVKHPARSARARAIRTSKKDGSEELNASREKVKDNSEEDGLTIAKDTVWEDESKSLQYSRSNQLKISSLKGQATAVGMNTQDLETVQTLMERISYFGAALFDPFSSFHPTPLPQPILSNSVSYCK